MENSGSWISSCVVQLYMCWGLGEFQQLWDMTSQSAAQSLYKSAAFNSFWSQISSLRIGVQSHDKIVLPLSKRCNALERPGLSSWKLEQVLVSAGICCYVQSILLRVGRSGYYLLCSYSHPETADKLCVGQCKIMGMYGILGLIYMGADVRIPIATICL